MHNSDNFIKNLGKNTYYMYAGRIVVTLLSGVIFIYLGRNLSIAEYGLYSFFLAVLNLCAFFLPLGFPSSLLRFIPEFIENKDFENAAYVAKKSLLIALIWGSIFLLLSIFSSGWAERIFHISALGFYFPVLIAIGIVAAQVSILENISCALFLQRYNAIYDSISAIAQFLLIVTFLMIGYSLYGVICAIGIANILLSLFYFNRISKTIFNKPSANKTDFNFSRFLKFSFKEFAFRAMGFFWDTSIDIYIITYILGASSAGLFGFASSICLFLVNWLPGIALQNLIRPLFAKIYARDKSDEKINRVFGLYNKFKAFFVFPVIVGMWLLIDKIILIIFKSKFLPVVDTFRVLLFFVMLQSFLRPINNVFAIIERNEVPVYSNVVIFYKLIASFLLIKYFGIVGAAWSFGSSIVLMFLIQYICLKRIVNVKIPYKSFFKIVLNSFVMGITIFLLRSKINNVASLIMASLTGFIVYIAVSCLNKSFEPDERSLLNSVIGIKIWNF